MNIELKKGENKNLKNKIKKAKSLAELLSNSNNNLKELVFGDLDIIYDTKAFKKKKIDLQDNRLEKSNHKEKVLLVKQEYIIKNMLKIYKNEVLNDEFIQNNKTFTTTGIFYMIKIIIDS